MNLPKRSQIKLESPIEKLLYQRLIGIKVYPETQYRIGKYRIDMAFPKLCLAIECDGKDYHAINQDQIERDKIRDDFLRQQGWDLIRISGSEIFSNCGEVAQRIKDHILSDGEIKRTKIVKTLPKINKIDYEIMSLDEIQRLEKENKVINEQLNERLSIIGNFEKAGNLLMGVLDRIQKRI